MASLYPRPADLAGEHRAVTVAQLPSMYVMLSFVLKEVQTQAKPQYPWHDNGVPLQLYREFMETDSERLHPGRESGRRRTQLRPQASAMGGRGPAIARCQLFPRAEEKLANCIHIKRKPALITMTSV